MSRTGLAVLGTTIALAAPGATSATAHAAASGVVFGGVTAQKWPVIVEVSSDRREVVQAAIGFTLNCSVGGTVANSDRYRKLVVSRAGKFSSSFGPETTTNPDGTKTVFSGSIAGQVKGNKAKGTWQLASIDQDAAGNTTKTCDSGKVSWSAKQ